MSSTPSPASPPLIAAIEAGGTKFVCAVASGPEDIRLSERIPTTTPEETLAHVTAFFARAEQELAQGEKVAAWGVATFGPAGVQPGARDYGFITTTPKPGWAHTDVLGALRQAAARPAGFDTDVNGAALAEWKWGAGRGKRSVLYLTIGTGIGGGLCLNGQTLGGLSHPEMGHVWVPRPEAEQRAFAGICPYHGACLEGLASGPALAARWGAPAETLPEDHPAWALQVEYLAHALCGFIYTLSPEVIVIGGGVGGRAALLPPLRERVAALVNGYASLPDIVPPGLGDRSGVLGAVALGQAAWEAAPRVA